ncbi:MAG: helix-turn-helix transcriptional regulator [Clostridiales bacterium]|nr:helix-turn-helix transcriptional regulator [Clostridiales bacterium]
MLMKDKLLYIRAKKNMSQEALARELGVSFATINRWEKGHTTPSKRHEMLIYTYCSEHDIVIPKSE